MLERHARDVALQPSSSYRPYPCTSALANAILLVRRLDGSYKAGSRPPPGDTWLRQQIITCHASSNGGLDVDRIVKRVAHRRPENGVGNEGLNDGAGCVRLDVRGYPNIIETDLLSSTFRIFDEIEGST